MRYRCTVPRRTTVAALILAMTCGSAQAEVHGDAAILGRLTSRGMWPGLGLHLGVENAELGARIGFDWNTRSFGNSESDWRVHQLRASGAVVLPFSSDEGNTIALWVGGGVEAELYRRNSVVGFLLLAGLTYLVPRSRGAFGFELDIAVTDMADYLPDRMVGTAWTFELAFVARLGRK